MQILMILAGCAVIFFAFKFNIFLGIAVLVALVALLYYVRRPDLYKIKGQKCFADGDYAGAGAWYKKAIDSGRARADTRIEYSYILLRTGEIDEAERMMNNLLAYKLQPGTKNRAIIQRCMCYYKKGNLDEAIADAQELYNDGYRSIMLYEMLGFFKILKAPDAEDTFEFCKEAYDYADDDRDIRDNLLLCYYNKGDYEKAKEISDKVLEDSPKFVEAWYHAALIDDKTEKYGEALEKLTHIKDCRRSFMTTISEKEIESFRRELEEKAARPAD